MSTLRRRSLGEGCGYVPGEQAPDGQGWTELNTSESPLAASIFHFDAHPIPEAKRPADHTSGELSCFFTVAEDDD